MERQKDENNGKQKFKMTPLNIVGIVLIVIFLPIIILNMVIVIKGALHPDRLPTVFNVSPLIVVSDSMTINKDAEKGSFEEGAFNKNDLIIIHEVDPKTLEVGDIITYKEKSTGEYITHRIIDKVISDKGNPSFVTKGDASPDRDPYVVTYDQVVGIYKTRLAGIGGVSQFIQTVPGILIIIGVPLLIFFGVDLVLKNKEKNKANSKTAELEAELALLKAEKAKQESGEGESSETPQKETTEDSADNTDSK